jgi:hypothetical protein
MAKESSLLTDLAMIEKIVLAIFSVEAKKETLALKKLKADHKKQTALASDLKAEIKAVRGRVPGLAVRMLPFLKSSYDARRSEELAKLRKRAAYVTSRIREIREKARIRQERLPVYKQNISWVRQRFGFLRENSRWCDRDLLEMVGSFKLGMQQIHASKELRKGELTAEVIDHHLRPLDRWIHATFDAIQREVEAKSLRVPEMARPDALTPFNDRVFLVMNPDLRKTLPAGGIRTAQGTGKQSPLYVQWSDEPNWAGHLDRYLPTAFQTRRRSYDFTELPKAARKQNLWQVFDDHSWSYIREAVRMATGNRCKICGSAGGKLIETVFTEESHKSKSVECHEVWDWEVLDEERSIGVQKLREILVLCNDCHMMFHEDYAVSKAFAQGKDGDEVRDFLRERMEHVTGLDTAQITAQRASEREIQDGRENIQTWLMDLSYLQEQNNLNVVEPVLKSDNPAQVSADMIAGLGFRTEDGEFHAPRSVSEIYDDLLRELEQAAQLSF